MDFIHIIGHEDIKNQMYNASKTGSLSHAHLFIGEDGIGKSLLAKAIALRIIDKQEERQYADIIEWRIGKNKKSIGVDDIRSIIEEVNKKPYEGEKKVIILYEADKMTVQAQNAFLKTIEEPPRGVFIILLCESIEVILETIRSRCQIHKLKKLSPDEMKCFLKAKYPSLLEQEIKAIIAFSDGIPGRAEKYLEDDYFKKVRDTLIKLLINVNNKNLSEMLKYEDFFMEHKVEWKEVLTCILSYIRDILIYKETGIVELVINLDKIEEIKEIAAMFSFNKLSDIIDIVNSTRENLERNVNTQLLFDIMLLKIQEV